MCSIHIWDHMTKWLILFISYSTLWIFKERITSDLIYIVNSGTTEKFQVWKWKVYAKGQLETHR